MAQTLYLVNSPLLITDKGCQGKQFRHGDMKTEAHQWAQAQSPYLFSTGTEHKYDIYVQNGGLLFLRVLDT
jgi:hypothetical protein